MSDPDDAPDRPTRSDGGVDAVDPEETPTGDAPTGTVTGPSDGAVAEPASEDPWLPPGPVLARLARPRSPTPTDLAVLSDVHLATDHEGSWKCFHRTADNVETALASVERTRPDAVVFAGDLTKDGHPDEFDALRRHLTDLSVPWLAVPGNHDVPKTFDDHWTPPLSEFERRFAPGRVPFVEQVGPLTVIGLDSVTAPDDTLADTHQGWVEPAQIEWLDGILADVERPVVVSHHNLDGIVEETGGKSWRGSLPMDGHESLRETLSRHDVSLHLSGHLHTPAVTGTDVRQVVAPSLCSFPQGYLHFAVREWGTEIRFVPVAGRERTAEAYMAAQSAGDHQQLVAEMSASKLEQLPLVDELGTPGR